MQMVEHDVQTSMSPKYRLECSLTTRIIAWMVDFASRPLGDATKRVQPKRNGSTCPMFTGFHVQTPNTRDRDFLQHSSRLSRISGSAIIF